jgi:tetratricopeptide (TPR) repeat protein
MSIRATRLAELLEQINNGQARKALVSINKWLVKEPAHHGLLTLKAEGLRLSGRMPEAIEAFKVAGEAGAGARNWLVAGMLLADQLEVDAALGCLHNALAHTPYSEEVLDCIVTTLFNAGRYTEGIEHARRLLNLSRNPHLLFNAAMLLKRSGLDKESGNGFSQLIELAGDDPAFAEIVQLAQADAASATVSATTAANRANGTRPRYLIVTPYYKESRETLERCIRSVRNQTVQVDHMLVADGFPQDWIDTTGVRHVRVDRAHGDYGNTPRAIGAMLAISEKYDGIGFLDADNWLDTNHVEVCTQTYRLASERGRIDYVIARRKLCRPDESVLIAFNESVDEHVDTNCFFFFPTGYPLIPHFGMMPTELSPAGDRFFYGALRERGLQSAVNDVFTVNYLCMWESPYLALGETPPHDAKPNIDVQSVISWLETRTPEERHLVQRLTGSLP